MTDRLFFLASGATVEIYDAATCQLLSTLIPPPIDSVEEKEDVAPVPVAQSGKPLSAKERAAAKKNAIFQKQASEPRKIMRKSEVTSMVLHPNNPLQLLVGSLDGYLRIWDFLEGSLIRALDIGLPVNAVVGHPTMPGHVFVSTATAGLEGDLERSMSILPFSTRS